MASSGRIQPQRTRPTLDNEIARARSFAYVPERQYGPCERAWRRNDQQIS